MSFNFGALAEAQIASDIKYLKPYTITKDVTYKSSEIKEGTSEKGNHWKCLKITLTSPDGEYTESIFYPKDGDEVRREVDGANGGKRLMCSNFEVAMATVAAFGHAFNPEGFKKMQAISSKFKSFDDVTTSLVKILEATKGKVSTSMKLIGRNNNGKVYARLPQPLGIIQDKESGEWRTFPVAVFGENLTFSSYEEKKRSELQSAKPTEMESIVDTPKEENSDIDFNTLL